MKDALKTIGLLLLFAVLVLPAFIVVTVLGTYQDYKDFDDHQL